MHNAALAELRLNWRYLAFDVDPAHLAAALTGARLMGFVGLNLTVPHKVLALNLVDEVDPAARRWGAVNTVRFEGRAGNSGWLPVTHFTTQEPTETRSVGFNTDADAIARAIREDLDLDVAGKRILVLGAGGAGRAAALRLADSQPGSLFLVNRTPARAEELAAEISRFHPNLQLAVGYPDAPVDLVLNATSLGLQPRDPLPVDREWLAAHRPACAYDMVYRPAETPFLKEARMHGARGANGLGMLLHQGADSLEIWSGRVAPRETMRRALEQFVA